jgi:hypothetical protein
MFVHSTLVSEADEKDDAFSTGKGGSRNTGSSAHQFHATSNVIKMYLLIKVHDRSFSLPLAKIYAQYLGGESTIRCMEGVGVDARSFHA